MLTLDPSVGLRESGQTKQQENNHQQNHNILTKFYHILTEQSLVIMKTTCSLLLAAAAVVPFSGAAFVPSNSHDLSTRISKPKVASMPSTPSNLHMSSENEDEDVSLQLSLSPFLPVSLCVPVELCFGGSMLVGASFTGLDLFLGWSHSKSTVFYAYIFLTF
jgi:hypothetical protein